MKIIKKICKVILSLLMLLTIVNNDSFIEAQDIPNVPNTLTMDVKRFTGGNFVLTDVTQGWALSDFDKAKVVITYQGGNNTLGNELDLTLPDYYSFGDIIDNKFYTSHTLSDAGNGKNNKVTLMMDDTLSNKANPETVSFDFDIALNRESIDKNKEAAWQEGIWNPNDGACDFIVEHNSGDKIIQTMLVKQKDYDFSKNIFLNVMNTSLQESYNADIIKKYTDFYYSRDAEIWKDGGGKYDSVSSKSIVFAKISYIYGDIYQYNPSNFKNLKFKLTLPNEFDFGEWNASEFTESVATAEISADKKSIIITLNDNTDSSKSLSRVLTGVDIKPSSEFEDGKKAYPANSEYPVKMEIMDASSLSLGTIEQKIKVVNYVDENRITLTMKGTLDEKKDRKILENVDAGASFDIYGTTALSNTRSNDAIHKEIETLGKDIIFKQEYDPNLQVNYIQLNNAISIWNLQSFWAANDWKSYTYTTNKGNSVNGSFIDGEKKKTLTLSDPSEFFTSVTIQYDKFAYINEIDNITLIKGKITEKDVNTGDEWKMGEDIPITTTVTNKEGGVLSEGKNYIRIKDLKCPSFNMGTTTLNPALGVGEYSKDESLISAVMYLKTAYVGTPKYMDGSVSSKNAEYIDVLENPVISVGGSVGTGNAKKIREEIVTNGNVNFAPIMGDGKWTVTLKTQSANGAENNKALKEYTVKLPAFHDNTKIDLKALATVPTDEYIIWFSMQHEGELDISSLSNYYTDANPETGTAVDKLFFSVENTNYAISPLTGEYYTNVANKVPSFIHISYDNCHDIDDRHLPSKNGAVIEDLNAYASYASYGRKGAETLILAYPMTTTSFTPQQGKETALNIKWSPQGTVSSNEYKYFSQGGEDFYFKLSTDALKYLSFANQATVDGMKADAEIITLKGEKFLKITNPIRDKYEKSRIKLTGNLTTFEAYDIDISVFTSTITPTNRSLNIFAAPSNGLMSFADYKSANYQEYEVDGKIIRNAFTISNTNSLGKGVVGGTEWKADANFVKRNYAGLYDNSSKFERHYINNYNYLYNTSVALQAYQGVVLNPGIDRNYAESEIQVRPWENQSLTTTLTLVAGQSEPMKGLTSTIALPRVGQEVVDNKNTYKSEVNLYLSGPIQIDVGFINSSSTKPVFLYSMDGGKTYVEEAKVSDWKKVTHFSIDVKNIAVGDGATYTIPMERDITETTFGKAYMPAVFNTSTLSSQSNRMNIYEFVGYSIDGTAWNDSNKDGMIDSSETRLSAEMNLYQNYGTGNEKLIATTTTDATTGQYLFHDLAEYENLTLISDLPSKKTVTKANAFTDNKFTRTDDGFAIYNFMDIHANQRNVNYGIRDLIEVTIGGADTATALTGMKKINGSLSNTDIHANDYTFNIVADPANPKNGTENIPLTITNAEGTIDGAALSFTGVDGWSFTKEGTYHFILNEEDQGTKGQLYDRSIYDVTIHVYEQIVNGVSTGKLQQNTTITKESTAVIIDSINFTNTAKKYTINYNTNEGTPALIAPKTNINWNQKNLLPSVIPTRNGYKFDGWEVATSSKATTAVTNEDTYAVLAGDDDTKTDLTLKAKWVKKDYQVSWISEDVAHGTLTPNDANENVKYEEFATMDITITPNTIGDQWEFIGWHYNYLPDGLTDVPANYITGTTLDYKTVAVKGDIVFTAKFAKKPFVSVESVNGYVAMNDGEILPVIPEDITHKESSVKIEYDAGNTDAKRVAVAFESQRHYHLKKVTIEDLYGHRKIIYTNIDGEHADTVFDMEDSTLNVDYKANGSLKITNIKNSLNVRFEFEEDDKYDVNFYTQSIDEVSETTVPYAKNSGLYKGDEYGVQPTVDPIKEGYRFSGWSTNGKDVNYNATDKIDDTDVKIYAIWNQETYTVKYNLNGGYYNIATSIPDLKTSFHGSHLLPTDFPRKIGYQFKGWYLNGVEVSDATKYKELVVDDKVKAITLNAVWKANEYTVSFDKNDKKATGMMDSQNLTYGIAETLNKNHFINKGYTFIGWSTDKDGNVQYKDGQSVQDLTDEMNGEVKLYAIWNANGDTPYQIEYYKQKNDGTWNTEADETVRLSGKSDTIANAILKTKEDSGYERYLFDESNEENVLSGTIDTEGTLVLKVYYKQVLSVEFDMDGGTPQIESQDVPYGEKAVKPIDPVKEGYSFISWEKSDGSSWNFDDIVTSNLTLKAIWKELEKEPIEPVQPNDPTPPSKNTPQTGDSTSNLIPYLALSVSSLLFMLLLVIRRKKVIKY